MIVFKRNDHGDFFMYKWTPEVRARVRELLLNDGFNDIRFGASAFYFQIYDDAGVKLFLSKKNRDFSYAMQKAAFKNGIAPWVSDRFEFPFLVVSHYPNQPDTLLDAYKREVHGYLTQHAPTIADTESEYSIEQYADLMATMEEMGMNTSDLNEKNMSLIENRLVCIDFDTLSQKRSY